MHADTVQHFFILGAAKAGTTSLHTWLDQHPAMQMSDPKEPFFFEAEYEKGLDYYRQTYLRVGTGSTCWAMPVTATCIYPTYRRRYTHSVQRRV